MSASPLKRMQGNEIKKTNNFYIYIVEVIVALNGVDDGDVCYDSDENLQ